MRKVLLLTAALLVGVSGSDARAQAIGTACVSRTGDNATMVLPVGMTFDLAGHAIEPGDIIRVQTPDGLCVGELVWRGDANHALTVWGDNPVTDDIDGIMAGEPLALQVIDGATVYAPLEVRYDRGDGTYASNGIFVVSSVTASDAGVVLSASVLLQGPWLAAEQRMSTALSAGGFLPLAQPFSAAAFDGTALNHDEAVVLPAGFFTQHPDVVDYVLVELRTSAAAASTVEKRVGLLNRNGSVVSLDGASPLAFPGTDRGSYYVVVRHRNHLPVMSAAPVDFSTGSATYDFTTSASKAYGANAMALLGNGRYGLYAGDADANGQVQTTDKNLHWWDQLGMAGYRSGDFDLNGQVQTTDKNLYWWDNLGRGSAL